MTQADTDRQAFQAGNYGPPPGVRQDAQGNLTSWQWIDRGTGDSGDNYWGYAPYTGGPAYGGGGGGTPGGGEDPRFGDRTLNNYLWGQKTGGFDSLLRMYEQNQGGGAAIQDLLKNFKGSKEELADFLEIAGPLYGGLEANQFKQSDAYKFFADKNNWDLGAMSGYGAAAGQIGRGTRMAQRSSAQGLASMGFGRSSARGAVQGMLAQQGMGQQATLRSQVEQQAAGNRANMAGQLMDANRLVAQMALGQQLTPRINSPQGGGVGMGQGAMQGALTGASAGMTFGPVGAIVGGLAGAGMGAASSK